MGRSKLALTNTQSIIKIKIKIFTKLQIQKRTEELVQISEPIAPLPASGKKSKKSNKTRRRRKSKKVKRSKRSAKIAHNKRRRARRAAAKKARGGKTIAACVVAALKVKNCQLLVLSML